MGSEFALLPALPSRNAVPIGRYVNTAIPADLAAKIDKLVKGSNLGYRSRQEFVIDASRQLVLQLEALARRPGPTE